MQQSAYPYLIWRAILAPTLKIADIQNFEKQPDFSWNSFSFFATNRSITRNINTPSWLGRPGCEQRLVICEGQYAPPPPYKKIEQFFFDFQSRFRWKTLNDLFLTQNFSKANYGSRAAFLPYLVWGFEKFLTKKLCQGWFLCKIGWNIFVCEL